MIQWQPGYVYPPVFAPPHLPLDVPNAIFFALVAIAVGALTYRRPALGVGALILCVPFADARYIGGGSTSISVPKVALIGFFIALLAHRPSLSLLKDGRVRLVLYGFVAVMGAIVLSALGARDHAAVLRELAKWIEYFVTFAAAAIAFALDPDDRPIWRALIAVAYIEGALCFVQLLTGSPSGVWVAGHVLPRVAGSIEGPNQFAGWLNLLIPVLFARTLAHRDPWLVGAVIISGLGEVAALSRAGIVVTVISLVVVVIVSRPSREERTRFAAMLGATLAIFITLGASFGLQGRFFDWSEVAQPDHLGTRAILWTSAVALWRTSPIFGVGAGNYEEELGLVGHPEVHTHANSLYLQALAETGVVGLAAVLLLVYGSIAAFARSFSRRPLVIGVLAANTAIAMHQVFDYLWFYPKVGSFWALLLGIGIAEVLQSAPDIAAMPESS